MITLTAEKVIRLLVGFGLGAILVGLLMLVIPDISLTAQLATWILTSLAMVILISAIEIP